MTPPTESNKQDQTNPGSTSKVSAKEQLDTHGSGEPSAENVDVKAGHGEASEPGTTSNANPRDGGASDVSAKEQLDTHGSGEPSAKNVDVQTDSQAAK